MEDDLEAVFQEYRDSIPGKIKLFEKLIAEFAKEGSQDTLKALRNEAHKVGGSAGTYDFNSVSMLCKGLVAEIDGYLQNAAGHKSIGAFQVKLQAFLKALKEEFAAGNAEKPQKAKAGQIDSKKTASHAKDVFLLEDDPDICNLLRFAFEKRGYHLTAVPTAEEALHVFENQESQELPALMIFDRLLPDGDGLEVYRKLKHKYRDLPPSLFLTKLSAEQDVLAGLKEGAIDYITKPFSLHVLMEKAIKLLTQQGK